MARTNSSDRWAAMFLRIDMLRLLPPTPRTIAACAKDRAHTKRSSATVVAMSAPIARQTLLRVARPATASLLVLAAGTACGSDAASPQQRASSTTAQRGPTTTTLVVTRRTDAATRDALDRVVAASARSLETTDVFTLIIFDYVARRYELASLKGARELALAATNGASPDQEPELRMIRPAARPTAASLREANGNASSMLVRNALACDSPGSAPDFETRLRTAIDSGGYALTHAAVALGIEAELRCPATGGTNLRAMIIDAIALAVADDTTVDDLSVERMAMLVYMDAAHHIPVARLDALVAAIRDDGTIAGPDIATQRHTAGLAIWVLGRFTRDETNARIVTQG